MIDRGGGSTPSKRPRPPLSLMDVNTRHQVHIESHRAHIAASFQKFLKGMRRDIETRLLPKDLTEYSRVRMENMLDHVRGDLKDRYGKYYGVWREQIVDFAEYDAEFQGKTMKELFDIDFDLPSRAQLRSAVLSSPLTGIKGPNNGMTLREFYADWAGRRSAQIEGVISRGYYQGLTTAQIVREVIGTKSAHYNDGELARSYRDMETMTRTAVQHAATQARVETLRENDDVVSGLQVVATLDDRTSLLCMSMDGKILDLDTQNLPPYHPGCRSTVVPVLKPPFDELGAGGTRIAKGPDGSEVVPAETTYFEWLKTRPAEFQDSALGPRRAELLRNGGLTAERFSELNLGRNFEPRTLEEIRRLEPAAFAIVENSKNTVAMESGDAGPPASEAPQNPFTPDAYSQERKAAAALYISDEDADAAFRAKSGEVWIASSEEAREAAVAYTGGSGKFNRPLRGYDKDWSQYTYKGVGNVGLNNEGAGEKIRLLTEMIDKSTYEQDVMSIRGYSVPGTEVFLGLDKDSLKKMTIEELKDKIINKDFTDESFLSTGASKDSAFTFEDVIYNIYCPSGTKMLYMEPFSDFGEGNVGGLSGIDWDGKAPALSLGGELELLIQRGTTFRITDVMRNEKGKIVFDMEVVSQSKNKIPR